MTEIEFLHQMVTAAGGNPDMLKDKLKSTYYECLIDCMKNGGGGSGGGSGSGEYTQPGWGDKEGVVLPETELTLAMNDDFGMILAMLSSSSFATPLLSGNEYTVIYAGKEYKCIFDQGAMGNMVLGGGEDTGEPFFIAGADGIYMIVPTDQQEGNVNISILGKVIEPIPSEYAPEAPYIDLVEAGLPTVKETAGLTKCDSSEQLMNQVKQGMKRGAVQVLIKLNGRIATPTNGGGQTYEDDFVIVTLQLGYAKAEMFDGKPINMLGSIYGSCVLGGSVLLVEFSNLDVRVSLKKIFDF